MKRQTIAIAKKLTFAVKHNKSDRINGSTAKALEIGNQNSNEFQVIDENEDDKNDEEFDKVERDEDAF